MSKRCKVNAKDWVRHFGLVCSGVTKEVAAGWATWSWGSPSMPQTSASLSPRSDLAACAWLNDSKVSFIHLVFSIMILLLRRAAALYSNASVKIVLRNALNNAVTWWDWQRPSGRNCEVSSSYCSCSGSGWSPKDQKQQTADWTCLSSCWTTLCVKSLAACLSKSCGALVRSGNYWGLYIFVLFGVNTEF